jgi:tripartite-type tricarboxylate transporter receptor subunit TctC
MAAFVRSGLMVFLGATLAAVPVAAGPAFDEKPAAEFYRGKTVRIIVGFSAGGFDIYTRLIARHLGRHIPGAPTVIVENMPGAGTVIAANHVYNAAPKDGTVIGNIGGPIVFDQLFGNPGVHYDMARFRYLAVPTRETYLMIVTGKSGVRRLDDLIGPDAKQVTFGGIGGSLVGYGAMLVRDLLGANVKLVSGYKGTSEVRLAMDSGEVQGIFNTWTSAKVTALEKLKSGEWTILAQLGDEPIPELPTPNVPTIPRMAKTAEQQQLLRFGAGSPSSSASST